MFGAEAGAQDALFPTPIFNSGWTAAYEDPTSGLFPEREYFNFLFRGLYALGKELNNRGVLEWNALCNYVHPAVCMGSDGVLRQSKQSSGPDYGGAKDPLSNATYWRGLAAESADYLTGNIYTNSISGSSSPDLSTATLPVVAGQSYLVTTSLQGVTPENGINAGLLLGLGITSSGAAGNWGGLSRPPAASTCNPTSSAWNIAATVTGIFQVTTSGNLQFINVVTSANGWPLATTPWYANISAIRIK